jgi:hypothetical protein
MFGKGYCHGFSPNLTLGHMIAGIRMEGAILAWKEPPAVHELGSMLNTNREFHSDRILVLRSSTNIIPDPILHPVTVIIYINVL